MIKQIESIWESKSVTAIPVDTFIYNFWISISFTLFGIMTLSLNIVYSSIQGTILTFPILYSIWKFKGLTRKQIIFFLSLIPMPFVMYLLPENFRNLLTFVFLMGTGFFLTRFPLGIIRAGSVGVLERSYLISMLVVFGFWFVYSTVNHFVVFQLFNGYGFILMLWTLWIHRKYLTRLSP